MFKGLKLIATGLILCLAFSNTTSAVSFVPEEEAIKDNKVIYDELSSEITALNSKISELDVELENLNNDLAQKNNELANIELEVKFTQDMLARTEKEIEETQQKIDSRIRSIYKSNLTTNMLVFILSSESFSDVFSRIDTVSRIVSFDREIMNEINEKNQTLKKNIDKLKKSEESIKNLKSNIEISLKNVEEKRKVQQSLIDELNSQKDAVFEVIEANEEKLIQHPVSIINSSTSSIAEIQNAINTLESLINQLNSPYVIGLAEDAIYYGYKKINEANGPTPTPPSNDGSENGIATYTMESTAYTGGGLTATGLKPVRDPNGISTVAVDPRVIPLGSKVHVSGYGIAIASDTGGAIKGNKIDVYLNTYNECISWGRRNVTVTLLAYPGEW